MFFCVRWLVFCEFDVGLFGCQVVDVGVEVIFVVCVYEWVECWFDFVVQWCFLVVCVLEVVYDVGLVVDFVDCVQVC